MKNVNRDVTKKAKKLEKHKIVVKICFILVQNPDISFLTKVLILFFLIFLPPNRIWKNIQPWFLSQREAHTAGPGGGEDEAAGGEAEELLLPHPGGGQGPVSEAQQGEAAVSDQSTSEDS